MKKYIVWLMALFLLVGCGGQAEPAAEVSAAPTSTATATAEPISLPTASPTAEPSPTVEPTATTIVIPPTPTVPPTATPLAGNDACLVGTWRVTNFSAYFKAVVEQAMADAGQSMTVESEDSGDLLLSFDGETMTMSDVSFEVVVTMMGQTVPATIDAAGSAQYTTADGILSAVTESLSVEETNQGIGFSLGSFTNSPIAYTCTADTLSWPVPDFAYEIILSRVP